MSQTKKLGKRRMPKRLSQTIYTYLEPVNAQFARRIGKKKFGSFSAYIDRLISVDRLAREQKKKAAPLDLPKAA